MKILVSFLFIYFSVQLKAEDYVNDKAILVCGVKKGSEVILESEVDRTWNIFSGNQSGFRSYKHESPTKESYSLNVTPKNTFYITYKNKDGKEFGSKDKSIDSLAYLRDLVEGYKTEGILSINDNLFYFCKKIKFKDYYQKTEVNDSKLIKSPDTQSTTKSKPDTNSQSVQK